MHHFIELNNDWKIFKKNPKISVFVIENEGAGKWSKWPPSRLMAREKKGTTTSMVRI